MRRIPSDQTLDVASLPAVIAETIRSGDISAFVRPMLAGLYGDLDPAIARSIDQQCTIDREVLAGNWQPLLTLDEDQLHDWLR